MPWTDADVETLKQLWAAGASARAIAAQIGGISRAAVLGKISRLRRRAAASPPAKPVEPAPADQVSASPADAASPARPRGKTLLELTNHSCRWPHGEPGRRGFHFCGADGADLERGMPYCPRHARRAFGSAPPVAKSPEPNPAAARRSLARRR